MESESETLRLQFQALQEQQQKKMQRRLQRQEEKKKKKKEDAAEGNAKPVGLDIGDDLGLSLSEGIPNDAIYNEELNTHLNQQIRELKDESGRLYKLLSERDYEIRRLKKQRENERMAIAGSGVASETAATKIVDLSKKNRELKSELESEKTKVKQILKKLNETEKQLNDTTSGSSKGLTTLDEPSEKAQLQAEMKQIQDKLNQTTSKMMEYRNQTSSLKQELKLVHKVLSQEVGENANVQALLSGKGGARGRAQQILNLQNKVSELESQLNQQRLAMATRPGTEMSLEDQFMTMDIPDDKSETLLSARTFKSTSSSTGDKNRTKIRQMERERKEAQAKVNEELKALELDHSKLKEKFDASKARNKVLANELKSLKQQVGTFIEKGKHDDELISALLKQQNQLKEVYIENHRQQEEQMIQQQQQQQRLDQQNQQEMNIVEQLKRIVAEKEQKVHVLEEEINQMRLQQEERHIMNGFAERPSSRGSRPGSTNHAERPVTRVVAFEDSINGQFTNGPVPPSRNGSRHSASSPLRLSGMETTPRPPSTSVRPSSTSTRPPSTSTRPLSASAIDVDELRRQCQEYKSISQVAEVEREKLMELVAILQKRVEEANESQATTHSQLQEVKRQNVQLEKQLGKLRIDTGRKGSSQSKSTFTANNKTEEELLRTDIKLTVENLEELQTRLAIQIDENDALKAALQSTMMSKDEDLKLYHQMMEQTRKVFLQGLRQFKQTSIGS
ncbi:coiled-coil domain-containing protein 13-like [Anneissia japonica]|uniref:coiled-coil domain-containing protein 13-like n=1 Tax=Anneissia japonica TaxID=1529436 RepID=UPI001425538F|nr:coiled-coil domain-containing protein 13-like [Anneissia japonica]